MKKIILNTIYIICFSILLCGAYCTEISAMEVTTYVDEEKIATYDLSTGGVQEFIVTDSNGQKIHISISELNNGNKLRIADKTYAVKCSAPFAWEAGYNVVIRNNSISSVNSGYVNTFSGKASNRKLIKESSYQATYYFVYTLLNISSNQGVRTTITGTTMNVYSI